MIFSLIHKVILLTIFLPLLFSVAPEGPDTVTCPTLQVAAVIRNTGDGWYAIDDASHAPINVESVSNTEKHIEVKYTFTAAKTNTLIVTTDETYAKQNIFVGSSVHRDKAIIYLSRNGSSLNPNDLVEEFGNFWIFGVFTANC